MDFHPDSSADIFIGEQYVIRNNTQNNYILLKFYLKQFFKGGYSNQNIEQDSFFSEKNGVVNF